MTRRLPPLKALKVFEVAARNESFAIAGEELFITASAVSHQIKALEDFLGVKLFKRTKRHVELTATGERYLQSIKESFNGIEVATQWITTHPNMGVVSINVAPNFLIRWLLPRLKQFQTLYPGIELQLSASNELIDLYENKTDMAIFFGHGDWHDIDIELLSKVYLVPVCTNGLLHAEHPLDRLEDLRHYPLIHVVKRLYEWPEWLQQQDVDYSGFSKGLQLSSSQLATAAALQNLGIALADKELSAPEIESGQLIVPFDSALDTRRAFYLAHNKNRALTDGMQIFKKWVLSEMQKSSR